jgi:DNA-binding NtrC family response regulator
MTIDFIIAILCFTTATLLGVYLYSILRQENKSNTMKKTAETSRAAWKSISQENLTDIYKQIIFALSKLGEGTFEDIAAYLKIDRSRVWKRMSELERLQLVYKPGRKKKLKSGREGFTYMLTSKALNKTTKKK